MVQTARLYEDPGGAAAVETVVAEFYQRVLADPLLAPFFGGTSVAALKRHQAAFITIALSGPGKYTGRSTHRAHAERGIADAHLDSVAGHLSARLAALGVSVDTIAEVIERIAPLRGDIVETATH